MRKESEAMHRWRLYLPPKPISKAEMNRRFHATYPDYRRPTLRDVVEFMRRYR